MITNKRVYKFYYALLWIWFHIFYRIRFHNRENVPQGGCIVCGNHTSMADPLMVAVGMKNSHGYNFTKFMAKKELETAAGGIVSKLAKKLIIFIDRGKSDINAIKNTITHLKDGGNIIIFPEGRRVDAGEDAEAKTGVMMMAMKSGAQILPVYITEKRKPPVIFGRVDVVFGEPYTPQKTQGVTTGEAYRIAVDDLMGRIHRLGETVKK